MRTVYWLSVLLCAPAVCTEIPRRSARQSTPEQTTSQQSASRPSRAVVVSSRNENGRTRLELQIGGDRHDAVLLARDSTVAPEAEASGIAVVAEVPGAAIVLVDRYASVRGGLSFCQAGEEQFLRVISIAGRAPIETFATKLASCRDSIELTERGLEWDAFTSTLRIHWLTGPKGNAEVRTIRVSPDGRTGAASKAPS
jgi:hypothetical protein